MSETDCLFCAIVAGGIPAEVVHETEHTLAFRDINPQAQVHVLVVPRDHYANAAEVAAADPTTAAEMISAAHAVAAVEGFSDYRLVFNTGPDAGQTVFHAHVHLMAGPSPLWPS